MGGRISAIYTNNQLILTNKIREITPVNDKPVYVPFRSKYTILDYLRSNQMVP